MEVVGRCSGGRPACRRGRASRRPDWVTDFQAYGTERRRFRRAGRPGSTAGVDARRYRQLVDARRVAERQERQVSCLTFEGFAAIT